MLKLSTQLALTSVLLISSANSGIAQDNQDRQSGAKRIAMALPKVPAQSTVPPLVKARVTVKDAAAALQNPQDEFANRPHISSAPTPKPVPDNIREVLIESAAKAEQFSRSYNRRLADAIVWIANSMSKSTSITPAASPLLKKQDYVQARPLGRPEHSLVQID